MVFDQPTQQKRATEIKNITLVVPLAISLVSIATIIEPTQHKQAAQIKKILFACVGQLTTS
jgi:hypothetical protein